MKKILAVICSLMLMLSIPLTVHAESYLDYGDWIMGFSDEEDTSFYIKQFKGEGGEVVIPDEKSGYHVITVGENAFVNNASVTSVAFGKNVKRVEKRAFLNNSALQNLELNTALRSVEEYAFSETPALVNVNLQDTSLTMISRAMFFHSGIKCAELPSSCTSIEEYAFAQCSQLEKITIPSCVTEIADTAFDDCDNLTIYCYTGSYAHEYAAAKEIPFVLLDAPVEYTFILGDADGDGVVTIMDATRIQRVLADLVEDTNGLIAQRASNGEALSIMHATRVQRWLVDYEVSAPIGTSVTCSIPYYLIF